MRQRSRSHIRRAETLAVTEQGGRGDGQGSITLQGQTDTHTKHKADGVLCFPTPPEPPTPFLRDAGAEVRVRCLGIREKQPAEEKDIR